MQYFFRKEGGGEGGLFPRPEFPKLENWLARLSLPKDLEKLARSVFPPWKYWWLWFTQLLFWQDLFAEKGCNYKNFWRLQSGFPPNTDKFCVKNILLGLEISHWCRGAAVPCVSFQIRDKQHGNKFCSSWRLHTSQTGQAYFMLSGFLRTSHQCAVLLRGPKEKNSKTAN